MKKFLLMALCAILYCIAGFAQAAPYDNQKTSSGEIYKAVYHPLGTRLPSVGRIATSPIWNIIKEEIDEDKTTFYYEIYYDYSKPKARFDIEQLKHTISALEQIWQEWSANDKQKGASMYFAKNGFVIGYDTNLYGIWQISLCKNDGFEPIKADKIPEFISAFKQALSTMEELSK